MCVCRDFQLIIIDHRWLRINLILSFDTIENILSPWRWNFETLDLSISAREITISKTVPTIVDSLDKQQTKIVIYTLIEKD